MSRVVVFTHLYLNYYISNEANPRDQIKCVHTAMNKRMNGFNL